MFSKSMPTERGGAPSHPSDPPDGDLVVRARAGDRGAFETLVRRYYRSAYSIALAYTRNRADAEDVCHDALVRAGARLATCRDPKRFGPWLYAIVRNHAKNAVARGFVRRSEPLSHATARSPSDPAADAERADVRATLERALESLSPVQREVVLLHDLDGRTHDEIAAMIGTSSGMCRQHLFKARRRLRAALGLTLRGDDDR
ncbi:MAG: RNA polymerase sigma factor [Gemmatimonadales bacterium]